MSTTSKGDSLEDKIFTLFQTEISEGRFFAKAENCKVFHKKGYYSKDREKDIVFDVSIEISLPGCDDYSVLMLIECKNYSNPVPVDDAEEFFTKIQQIGGAKTKGVIASTNSFQEGTLTFSRSKGIGLLRYFDDSNFKWSLARAPALGELHEAISLSPREIVTGLLSFDYRSVYHHFFCRSDNVCGTSMHSFLLDCMRSALPDSDALRNVENAVKSPASVVQFLPREEIDQCAESVLKGITYSGGSVSLDVICEQQVSRSGLVLRRQQQDISRGWAPGVMARIQFDPLEITLYEDPDWNLMRQRFTLAHELGHLLLGHSEYISREYCEETDFSMDRELELGRTDIRRIEWQANYFASCLLLPKTELIRDVLELTQSLGLQDRGHGLLFVDTQPCNQDSYYHVTDRLCMKYRVSRTVVKIRLEELGVLNDVRKGA